MTDDGERMFKAIKQIESAIAKAGILDFSGELQLLQWSKSTSTDGPKVKFMLLDDEAVTPFEAATIRKGKIAGQIYHVFAVRLDGAAEKPKFGSGRGEDRCIVCGHTLDAHGGWPDAQMLVCPPKAEPAHKTFAQMLHINGYFRDPKLWRAMHDSGLYTVQQHKVWLQGQPCFAVRGMALFQHACGGDVVCHHEDSAAVKAAGKQLQPEGPQKPPHWYGVPACHVAHTWVHSSTGPERGDHQKLHELAIKMTETQINLAMKDALGVESFNEVSEATLRDFEDVELQGFEGIWRARQDTARAE
jgi:hypothetical protein